MTGYGRRLLGSIAFWIMLGIAAWSFTFAWAWSNARAATEREAQIAHDAAVLNCRSIQELKRKIYITLSDFKVPEDQKRKYLPSRNCERLP